MNAADQVIALFAGAGDGNYFGERVTQLEHALQCAHLAAQSGASGETVLAALLHDAGHLLDSDASERHPVLGVLRHEKLGADWLRSLGFSERVLELVGSHVDAKRYLTYANPAYRERLSEASQETLRLQGGPMTGGEAEAFRADPLFEDKLRIRSWDDQAKAPGLEVPGLESYRPLIEAHLARPRP